MSSFIFVFLFVATMITQNEAGGDGGSDRVIIHVPYHIKTIKHTHTITKHIHHKDSGGGGDKYEILGYTYGHPINLGGHGGGHNGIWTNDFGNYDSGSDFGGGHDGY